MINDPSQAAGVWSTQSNLGRGTPSLSGEQAPDASISTSRGYLADFKPTVLAGLTSYARRRLIRVGLSADAGEDIVHDAVCAVLAGGRQPRSGDLINQATFLSYLQGVIRSLIEGMSRRRNFASGCLFENSPGSELYTVPEDSDCRAPLPDEQAAVALFAEQFFHRLKIEAPSHLLPIVNAWAEGFSWHAQIPLAGKPRSFRSRVRILSRRIFTQLHCITCRTGTIDAD